MHDFEKKNQFYFPIYAIRYSENIRKTFEYLISYCTVEYGYRLMNNFEMQNWDYIRISGKVTDTPIKNFNESEEHYYIVFAALKTNIIIYDIKRALNQHREIENFISYYEFKYDKDARVKIHKDLMFEVKYGKFDYNLFRVYLGIKSIVGTKKFCRITYNSIRYRMLGYKSKKIFESECCKDKLFTIRRIETLVAKLKNKGLIDTITYRKRIKFYSTRYKGRELDELIANSIANNKLRKKYPSIRNENIEESIETKVNEMSKKLKNGMEYSELKSQMRLVK